MLLLSSFGARDIEHVARSVIVVRSTVKCDLDAKPTGQLEHTLTYSKKDVTRSMCHDFQLRSTGRHFPRGSSILFLDALAFIFCSSGR